MSEHEPLANWNGCEIPLSEVLVPATDRAFLFGDGVYEVVRVYGGKPWLLEEHFTRLAASLRGIQVECDLNRLKRKALTTLDHASVESGLIYIQITRGAAKRSHNFPRPLPTPNELIYVQLIPLDKYEGVRECGVRLVTSEDIRWQRCDIKSVNLLPNCLALESATQAGAEEAIFVGSDGCITEGTHTNVFGIIGETLFTAPLSHRILPGITRAWVLRNARKIGLGVHEAPIRADEISRMSEMFLTGTTTEILGVRTVDETMIGEGHTGEITKKLFNFYRAGVSSMF